MKRYILFATLGCLAILMANCKKEQIPVYSDGHYVQFIKRYTDTTTLSFFFYAGRNEIQVPMPVKLIGHLNETDLRYEIMVDPEGTTASAANYAIEPFYTFRKGGKPDTAYITLKNTPDLKTKEVKLAFFIKNTDQVKAGQHEYTYHVIKFSDRVAKPVWWDANMDRFYLGNYSEAKYRAFMDVTGVGDLSIYNDNERRILMLEFKYYLIEMKEKGTPVLLEDGSDMLASVPLIG